jgi:hypothetical protein
MPSVDNMNERIKVLMVMAEDPDHGFIIPEKFAELIVRECIDTLNKRFMGDLNREDMEVRRCIEDVKKHFGIEE